MMFGLPPAIALLTAALAGSVGKRLLEGLRPVRPSYRPVERCLAVVLCASALAFLLITLIRYGLLKNSVISDDEHTYAFMGQLFAPGRRYVPSLPPVPPALPRQSVHHLTSGKMYGMYFPGHSAALAIGVAALYAMAWVPDGFGDAQRTSRLRRCAPHLRPPHCPAGLAIAPRLSRTSSFPPRPLLARTPTAAVLLLAFVYSVLRLREHPELPPVVDRSPVSR